MCLNCQAQKDSVTATSHIDEVEVTAMSLSNDLHSIAPHYSLKSADFQRLNISDISSALRRLPGTILRDYGGAGGMKTVSVRGMGAQHTGVALDGMLLTDVQSGQIDLQQFQLSEITSLSLAIAGSADIFEKPCCRFSPFYHDIRFRTVVCSGGDRKLGLCVAFRQYAIQSRQYAAFA